MRLFHMAIAAGVFSMTSQQTHKTVTRNVEDMDVDSLEEVCQVFITHDLLTTAAWTKEPMALDITSNLYQWFIQERASDEAEENWEELLMSHDHDIRTSGGMDLDFPEHEWDSAFYNDGDYYPSRDNVIQ